MVAMADVVAYFAGGRTVTVQRESYAELVAHPRLPAPPRSRLPSPAPSARASSRS